MNGSHGGYEGGQFPGDTSVLDARLGGGEGEIREGTDGDGFIDDGGIPVYLGNDVECAGG